MAVRQHTYGKHRRLAVIRASIWESPSKEDEWRHNFENKAKQAGTQTASCDQLASSLGNLAIATEETVLKPTPKEPTLEVTKTITVSTTARSDPPSDHNLPVKRTSPRSKTNPVLSVLPPVDLDVTALLEESYSHRKRRPLQIRSFSDFADTLNQQFAIKKRADGSFGDVYKLVAHSTTKARSKDKLEQLGGGVLKIIPLCGKTGPGARTFSRIDDVLSEVKLLRRLDALHGFTRFRDIHVVQGRYPPIFTHAFHEYNNNARRQSDKPAPEKAFDDRQLFAILDMDDAGDDLECLHAPNIFQIHDVFWACAIVLAHGEAAVEFEARDMHIGNICMRPFVRHAPMDVSEEYLADWSNKDHARLLGCTGIRVTLIDYTLSRAKLHDGTVAYTDLRNKAFLFPRAGVNPETLTLTLQQRAYSRMRDAVRRASSGPSKNKRNEDWARFTPQTNLVWLAYLLETLLATPQAVAVVQGSNSECAAVQVLMRAKLDCVLRALKASLLEIETEEKEKEDASETRGIGSTGDLLQMALDAAWLNKAEIEWYKLRLESEA